MHSSASSSSSSRRRSLRSSLDGWEEKLSEAGDAIGRLMPPHIEKEESVLFPMAEQMLGKEEWGEVRALWNQARAAASTE